MVARDGCRYTEKEYKVMSVLGLTTTLADIYRVADSQDQYGALIETYTLIYSAVPVRVKYLEGQETIIDGKEMNAPVYRIYVPTQFEIKESDKIVDSVNNNTYDILNVYDFYQAHQQVDAKLVDMII